MKLLLLSSSFLFSLLSFSQTFNGGGGPITDNQTTDFPLNVSGLPNFTDQTSFGIETVCINIEHPYDADLDIWIVSPDGNISFLVNDNGGSGNDYTNTCFLTSSSASIYNGAPPFSGTYKPDQNFGSLNNGQNPNGIWKLRVTDDEANDVGQVFGWSITFGNNPAHAVENEEFELPLVILNTFGQSIPNEPKLAAYMGIVDNGPGNLNHRTDPYNVYNNKIGIELRGSSSANFPQKSYGFETRDVNGTKHDTVLMGMPEEHDWILYAPYDDKTCMRNILSYHVANETGHYASRTKMVEVLLNNNYQGIYVMMEKIKRDNGRVDIAKLEPAEISGDDLTGGYIFKVDRDEGAGTYWSSEFQTSVGSELRFVYVEPKAEDIVPQQKDYIQQYVNSFETALRTLPFDDTVNGYRKFADAHSFIDYFLLNEVSKNVDGYRLSTFLHKDKESNGGKLKAGPAWDYNLAWWNADYCAGDDETGWAYKFNDICGPSGNDVPFWWDKFLEDEWYQNEMKCRWNELRQSTLSISHLETFIDSVAGIMTAAQERHFEQWPILGVYTWPNPSPIPEDFEGEIEALKLWIHERFDWMDANLPGTCYLSAGENLLSDNSINIAPNPFSEGFSVKVDVQENTALSYALYDLQGKALISESNKMIAGKMFYIDAASLNLASGIYTLQLAVNGQMFTRKVVKQ